MKTLFVICMLLFTAQIFAIKKNYLMETEIVLAKVKMQEMVAKDQTIRDEILRLQKESGDQILMQNRSLFTAWRQIDAANIREVRKILTLHGWPKSEIFGKKYCDGMWLLVQHADNDSNLQKLAIKLMLRNSLRDKDISKHYAYLFDRIQMHQFLPQRYGTQGFCVSANHWQCYKLEGKAKLNILRQSVGLGSFEIYQEKMNTLCH